MSAQELPLHTNGPQPRQQVEVAIALIVQFPIPLTSKLLMFTNVTMGCLNGLESKLLHLSNINIRPAAFPPANKITIELSVLQFFFRYNSNYCSIVRTSCYGSLQYRVQSLRCSSGREKERFLSIVESKAVTEICIPWYVVR